MVISDHFMVLFPIMSIRTDLKISDYALANTLCHRATREVPGFRYAGCELRLHRIHLGCSPAGSVVSPHKHGFYEAIIILKGTGQEALPYHGKLKPGVLQLHPPHMLHGWKAVSSSVLRFGIWFDLNPPVPMLKTEHWPISPSQGREVQALLNEVQTEGAGRYERVTARIILLLAPLLKLLEWPESAVKVPDDSEAEKSLTSMVDQFLDDNLAQPITMQDVATQMNMSIPTLGRHIRREASCSVINRLRALRMQRAAQLLQEGKASVKEIGSLIGISEPSYFCRCFRRHFGQSPRRWQTTGKNPRT